MKRLRQWWLRHIVYGPDLYDFAVLIVQCEEAKEQSFPPASPSPEEGLMNDEIERHLAHLELLTKQLREQGDVGQVLLSEDGVDEAPTLADELWLIAYNLRAALRLPPGVPQ